MKTVLPVLILLQSFALEAQRGPIYYTENWIETKDQASMHYFRVFERYNKDKETRGYTLFYKNGKKLLTGQYDGKNGNIRTGNHIYYYANNKIKQEGQFLKNKKSGLWKGYFENGVQQFEGRYIGGKQAGHWKFWYQSGTPRETVTFENLKISFDTYFIPVVDYWDSTGTQLVFNGTGIYKTYDKRGLLISQGRLVDFRKEGEWIYYDGISKVRRTQLYVRGKLSEQSKKGQATDATITEETTTLVEKAATPVGGMKRFMKYLSAKIRYPETARKYKIEGRVFVQFVVDKDGTLTDVAVVKGIGGGCDQEAIRVIENAPKWIPATQNGELVKQKLILPIVFGR